MLDPESEETMNLSEFINNDSNETQKETVVSPESAYSNEDLKEMHKSVVEFLEFISEEYEKNEG